MAGTGGLMPMGIRNCTEYIKEGAYHRCLFGAIFSPSKFYVLLQTYTNRLESYMKYLNETFTNSEFLESRLSKKKSFSRGSIVAVLYEDPSQNHKIEWHRGKIIEKLKNDTLLVVLIDFGEVVKMNINKIMELPNRLDFTRLPAQAIECRIDLYTYEQNGDWTPSQISTFKNVIMKYGDICSFGIKFKKAIPLENFQQSWVVSIDVFGSPTSNIPLDNGVGLERKFLCIVKRQQMADEMATQQQQK